MIGSQFLRNSETSAASCDNLPLKRTHCVVGLFGCLSKENQLDYVYIKHMQQHHIRHVLHPSCF